jgi:hypothetical protein
MTRRETSPDTKKAPCDSQSGIVDVSCLLPLPAELHAMCHCGASAEICSPPATGIVLSDLKIAFKTFVFSSFLVFRGKMRRADDFAKQFRNF